MEEGGAVSVPAHSPATTDWDHCQCAECAGHYRQCFGLGTSGDLPPPPHCTAASGSVHCSIATTTFHSRIHFCSPSFCLDYFTVSSTQLAGRNVTPIDEHGTDRTVAMAHIGGASILNITQPTRYYTLHPSPPHTASERCVLGTTVVSDVEETLVTLLHSGQDSCGEDTLFIKSLASAMQIRHKRQTKLFPENPSGPKLKVSLKLSLAEIKINYILT